jgi:tRNA (guanine37-N1)-methyltransferase
MKQILPSGYDIIGSREKAVAIVEIPSELKKNQKKITESILKRHKNVKSVLMKTSERRGIFRLRKFKLLMGERDTEVIHAESGCRFKLDPRKVYFSVREGTERLRISKMVKPEENVLVMFGGVGPYPIIIAKKQPKVKKIISIEINPKAYEYMKKNVSMNKFSDKIIPVIGDVKKECKNFYGEFDRAIMPLPHKGLKFLRIAYKCLKPKGGIIHLYFIEKEDNFLNKVNKIMGDFKKKIKRNLKYDIRRVLPYAPRTNKYCIDIKILNRA